MSNDFNDHSVKIAIDNTMKKLYVPPKKLSTSSKKEAPVHQADVPSNSPEPEKKNEPPTQLSNKKRDKRKIINRNEIELRAKEIIALEDLLNGILRKELEVENGIQIANYLFNHKKHIPELMDIYNIQKQNNKDSNFSLDTRIQALQSWYLNKKESDNQIFDASKIISEDTAKLFRDTKINYQSLIREHLAEIKFAIEKTGFKNVAIIFGCTESALRDNLVKIDTAWYSKLIDNKNKGNNFKN